MHGYKFSSLLTNTGWIDNAYVTLDDHGLVKAFENKPSESVKYEEVDGFAVPGFQNAHSHAFQYAMAGLAERRNPNSSDDFWGWRETMYQIALTLNPDQLEHVATMLYAEMARHGYTHVAEFHYLHHDPKGKEYSNLVELGERLVRAAVSAGIGITLVPMFYQMGGFGMAPQERQRRFISPSTEKYFELYEATKAMTGRYPHANYGFGIHSLRAVHPSDVVKSLESLQDNCPIHIHISEQLKEVEDAKTYLGARPVEWLLDNCEVNDRFHLVHATHLDKTEVLGIAKSGAHVVLCPSTEGNLGDGLFQLEAFQNLGGKWSIGTDSHIGLSPLEELRLLDYGQRLTTHRRSSFYDEWESDSGHFGFNMALLSGRKAMGNEVEAYIEIGQPLNVSVFDASFPLFAISSASNLLSTIIYAGDASSTIGTIANGKWIVKSGAHILADEIKANFGASLKSLGIR